MAEQVRRGAAPRMERETESPPDDPTITRIEKMQSLVREIEAITLEVESSDALAQVLTQLAQVMQALHTLAAEIRAKLQEARESRESRESPPTENTEDSGTGATPKAAVESDLAEVRASDRTPGSKD